MTRHNLDSRFYKNLERLSHLVLGIHEAYGVFSAVEKRADEINNLAIGRPFSYLQWLTIERMFLNFGKATSKHDDDLSFRSIRASMEESCVIDRAPIDKYLQSLGISATGSNERKKFCSFREDFYRFDDEEFMRIKSARDRFVAHTDKVAKWNDIGVKFTDFERFLAISKTRIDTCFHCFFDLSTPKVSLYDVCKEEPDRNIRSFKRLIENTIVAAQNK